MVGDEDGKSYLEEQLDPGGRQWTPTLFVRRSRMVRLHRRSKVRPLAREMAGVAFRYHTNRHYYLFALTGGTKPGCAAPADEQKLRVPSGANWRGGFLLTTPRGTTRSRWKTTARDARLRRWQAGARGHRPRNPQGQGRRHCQQRRRASQDFRVSAPDAAKAIEDRVRARGRAETPARRQSQAEALEEVQHAQFGAGRNARFGDLDGDGVPDMLIAQNIPRIRGRCLRPISCLTAVTLDGKILWQNGRPIRATTLLTNDTPFQIHDIDGDGKNEVVMVKDFQLQILDGRTGEIRQSAWMPKMPAGDESGHTKWRTGIPSPSSISGNRGRHEILVKDRYTHFWIYNNKLELLWKGRARQATILIRSTSMAAAAIVHDRLFDWSPDGKHLWSHDKDIQEHADGVMVGNFTGTRRRRAARIR